MVGNNFKNKKIIVITGPSGAGKTTVAEYLDQKYQIPKTITHTTRAPRVHEQDGVDYFFETDQSFQKLHLLESVDYAGSKYGSSIEALEKIFEEHDIASIVIDTVGAITYQQELPEQVEVAFVTVSTPHILSQRLVERGDDPKEIEERTVSEVFTRDMQLPKELQGIAHQIKNDDWEEAKQQIDQLIASISNK